MMVYAQTNLGQDKSWNFSQHVFDFSDQLFKEDAIRSISLLQNLSGDDFLKVQQDLVAENAKIEAMLERNATEALDLIASKGLSPDDFQNKSTGITAFFRRIQAGDYKPASDTIRKNIAEKKWGHPQSPNKHAADQIGDLLGKYFEQIDSLLEGPYKKYLVNCEILKNINNLSLMNHMLRLVDGIKEEENILLISDFYKKIAEIILNEPVPFIYEKIGVRYEHFLLDEFQDTSHLQWVNMVPLIHNSLASGNANLVVGDGKQAIYRWRGGEVEQFTGLPDKVYNPGKIPSLDSAQHLFREMGERLNLTDNYRSAPEIIRFNNDLFDLLMEDFSASNKEIYAGHRQKATRTFKGYVEARIEDHFEECDQLDYVLATIRSALEKGFSQQDICVLTRSNRIGSLVADFLTSNGIRVISPDSLFIGKDLAVKFVFNVICSAAVPGDRNYKIKALEHFAALKLSKQPGEVLEAWKDKLRDAQVHDIFYEFGYTLRKPESFHNLYEYVEAVMDEFELDLTNNAYLQFFLEEVHMFETTNNPGLRDFVDWFETSGSTRSIVSPEGANAVQVMTIHKAKGLQFPVVICPFFDWKIDLSRQVSWVENEEGQFAARGGSGLPAFFVNMTSKLAETELRSVYSEEESKFYLDNLNLLYVAFTRPEVALFISGDSKKVGASPLSLWLNKFLTSSPLMSRNGTVFFTGEFVNPCLPGKRSPDNYPVVFLRQRMDKPRMSLESFTPANLDELDEKRRFGTRVHLVLSTLDNVVNLDQCLAGHVMKGTLTNADCDAVRLAINTLSGDKNFMRYFEGDRFLTECEIIGANGKKMIPDRVVFQGESVLVVDFKTGTRSPAHQEQLQHYVEALKEMGYKNVSGELYYIPTREMVPL
jgi:ATP-dependent exoDNAse (exonuclease V) beta subunit